MRYERRDPRPEDLRQIDELKSMVDSQEKDISYLTGQLRSFSFINNSSKCRVIRISRMLINQSAPKAKTTRTASLTIEISLILMAIPIIIIATIHKSK